MVGGVLVAEEGNQASWIELGEALLLGGVNV